MPSIRTLIADDEAVAREGLRKLLQQEPDIDIVAECANGREAADTIRAVTPDLVFMDVQMPGLNGFEALTEAGIETIPVIIFVTAYDQYALRAFDVHAVDYLLKPFTNKRLQEALDHARQRLQRNQVTELNEQIVSLLNRLDDAQPDPAPYPRRIPVRNRRRVHFIDVDDIDWMEAADNYVCLHVGDQTHLIRATLTEMEERLDPDRFLRIHRSRIVNIDRIREVHPRGSGDCALILHDGTELLSSRTYSDRRHDVLHFSS